MTDEWLLIKRGLYYGPDNCGYTGIRDHAGRYSLADAHDSVRPGNGVSTIQADRAPEFSEACYEDLARAHLSKQRDDARAEIERLRATQIELRAEMYGEVASRDAEIERLRAALKPFAGLHTRIEAAREMFGPDHWPTPETGYVVTLPEYGRQPDFTFADLVRAADAVLPTAADVRGILRDEQEAEPK
jgi:hypothetical protein